LPSKILFQLGSLALGIYAKFSSNREEYDSNDYFLAGRSMSWVTIAASLFATNIGAEHFVGTVGAACYEGIAVALYEFSAVLVLLFLGSGVLPVYMKANIVTIPEYDITKGGIIRTQFPQ
jgi:uncharacterized sodium:solute symporter family permease YidK